MDMPTIRLLDLTDFAALSPTKQFFNGLLAANATHFKTSLNAMRKCFRKRQLIVRRDARISLTVEVLPACTFTSGRALMRRIHAVCPSGRHLSFYAPGGTLSKR